jgi:hypothetical protein
LARLLATHLTYAISSWRGGQGVGSVIGNPVDVCNFLRGVEVNIILHAYATKMGVYDVTKGYVLRQLDGVRWILKRHLSTKVTGCIYHPGQYYTACIRN